MGLFDRFSREPNEFFNHQQEYDNEKFMYSSLATEATLKFGIKCKYYVIGYNIEHNPVFGEDEAPIVGADATEYAFPLKAIPSELPQEQESWSAFGQEGTDSIKLYIPIEHFRKMQENSGKPIHTPRIGDLVKTEYNEFFLEVTFVSTSVSDEKFLHFKHIYELSVRKMVIDENIESVESGVGMDDLVDLFNTNSRKLDISDKIDDLKEGSDAEAGKDVYPTSGSGKNTILYDPQNEKNRNFKDEGW